MTEPSTYRGFGPDVIAHLVPHRRPFLMVDRVQAFTLGETRELRASRFISSNEEVFAGHFPGLSLWPGVYTIEGLGQSAQLLFAVGDIAEEADRVGLGRERVLAELAALEARQALRPSRSDPEALAMLLALGSKSASIGMSSRVDVRLTEPVFAGQRLDYFVRVTHMQDGIVRFAVEASVDGCPVAHGQMTASTNRVAPPSFGRG